MPAQNAPIEDQILVSIRRIIRAIELHSRQLMDKCGLTGPQLATLQALERGEGGNAKDLAGVLHVSQPTMSGILDRLERASLIVRSRSDQDRRSVDVTLSEKGHAALKAAPLFLQDRFRVELAKLNEWERTMLLSSLQRVGTMLDAAHLDAAPHLVPGAECL